MHLSPDGSSLAVLHMDGTLSLWHVPSLRFQQAWHPEEQVSLGGGGRDWETGGDRVQ